jgi:2'-5' RNA ligase
VKAGFALLADLPTANFARRLAWKIHQQFGTGLHASLLPPHVSLKQPFTAPGFAELEPFLDELAKRIKPFPIQLSALQVVPIQVEQFQTGLVWLDVIETPQLRALHNQLNAELEARFGNTQAAFDGSDYHFHMTVIYGGQPTEVYRQIEQQYAATPVDLRFTAAELALAINDEQIGPHWYVMASRPLTG